MSTASIVTIWTNNFQREIMKTKITILLTALMLSAVQAAAAEVTPAECSAIRATVKILAEANRDASKTKLEASKAVMSVMVDAYGQSKVLDGLKEVSETLNRDNVDTAAMVPGLMALNKVCPP